MILKDKLFTKSERKKWDYCILYVAGRPPIGLEQSTKLSCTDDELTVEDPNAENLFRQNEKQPATAYSTLTVRWSGIVGYEFLVLNPMPAEKRIIT